MSTPNNGISGTLGNGLIGHWGFDNGSLNDESGNGRDLTMIGTVASVADKDGNENNAMDFDGASKLVTPFSDNILEPSISVWFKKSINNAPRETLVNIREAGSNVQGFGIYFFTNILSIITYTGEYVIVNDGSVAPCDGQWHNAVATYNKAQGYFKLYIDKKLIAKKSSTKDIVYLTFFEGIGIGATPNYSYPYYYDDAIDEVRIYNRPLTDGDITTIGETATGEIAELYEMGVNYVAKCKTPTANISGGYYAQSIYEIELATETNGARIYYTLDGTEPSNISALYTGKITVDTTLTLKAVAIKENFDNSDTMTETYYLTERKYSTQKYIRLFENTLEMVAEFDTYKSLIFERRLYSAGNFTLTIDYNVTNAKELMIENRLIVIDNNPHKVGIIKGFKYSQNGNNETLIITGYELKGIFRQRVTIPDFGKSHQRITNKSFETIAKELVKKQCIDSTTMKFDNLQNVTDTNLGIVFSFETRYKNIAEELEKICRFAEIGYNIYIDFNKKLFLFDIIRSNRLLNPACDLPIFSSDFDNIITQEYTKNSINSNNYAIVAGQGVGESRTIKNVVLGDEKGLELNVLFVDARDINDDAELENRGYLKLSESAPIKSFDCEISDNILKYETDWDLGDTVKIVSKKFGIAEDNIIEQITEYHESGSERTVQVVFGKAETGLKKYIDNKNDVGID